jgi:hypothetical protein
MVLIKAECRAAASVSMAYPALALKSITDRRFTTPPALLVHHHNKLGSDS